MNALRVHVCILYINAIMKPQKRKAKKSRKDKKNIK